MRQTDSSYPANLWIKIEAIAINSVYEILVLKYFVWLQWFFSEISNMCRALQNIRLSISHELSNLCS